MSKNVSFFQFESKYIFITRIGKKGREEQLRMPVRIVRNNSISNLIELIWILLDWNFNPALYTVSFWKEFRGEWKFHDQPSRLFLQNLDSRSIFNLIFLYSIIITKLCDRATRRAHTPRPPTELIMELKPYPPQISMHYHSRGGIARLLEATRGMLDN